MPTPAYTAEERQAARGTKAYLLGRSRRRNGPDEQRWLPHDVMLVALISVQLSAPEVGDVRRECATRPSKSWLIGNHVLVTPRTRARIDGEQ